MKASIRLVALAFTAVALAAPIGAQGRRNQRDDGGRTAAPRGQAQPRGYAAPHWQSAPRGYAAPRGYVAPRGYAPRGGQTESRGPQRAPQDFNGRNGYRMPVA